MSSLEDVKIAAELMDLSSDGIYLMTYLVGTCENGWIYIDMTDADGRRSTTQPRKSGVLLW